MLKRMITGLNRMKRVGTDGVPTGAFPANQPPSFVNPMAKRFAAIVAREINSQMYR